MAATTRTSSSARAFAHLRFDGVSFSYGAQRVLTDISFTAPAGTRTGLIGENGSGKSTLLRLAAGLLVPDVGTITATAPGDASPRIGLLHQEVPFSPTATVAQALESAVAHLRSCLLGVEAAAERLAAASDEHAERAAVDYDRALESAERLGVWDVDARIDRMMAGLGLGVLPRDRPTGALSGGQRSRLALAWLLLSAPDVLLLDEPTNHLDDAATAYLCAVLSQWGGPVLVVSHDRAFLDEVVTHLVDLDPSPQPNALAAPLVQDGPGAGIGISRFTGTYSDDLQARRDIRDRWEHRYESEQAELRRLRAAIQENQVVGHPGREPRTEARSARKFYADRNAMTVSRRVNDARGRLDDLEKSQLRKPPPELHFRGLTLAGSQPPCQRDSGSPPVVLDAQDVAVAGRLSPTSLTVRSTQKWLVTGANGVGKSTLLHLFAGDLSPTSGTVTRADGCGSVCSLRRVFCLTPVAVGLPGPPERLMRTSWEKRPPSACP